MAEQNPGVFAEFEAKDRKLAKQQKRMRRARQTLIFICIWSAYISFTLLLSNRIVFISYFFTASYICFYFLSKKWPGTFLLLSAIMWAYNAFMVLFERFVIMLTAYYREHYIAGEYNTSSIGPYFYIGFSIEVLLKLAALTFLIAGVVASARYRRILKKPLPANR